MGGHWPFRGARRRARTRKRRHGRRHVDGHGLYRGGGVLVHPGLRAGTRLLERYLQAGQHAPGLDAKRKDLRATSTLGDAPDPAWTDVLDQVALEGFSFANEVVFFHRPSQTLILTDIAFNVGPEAATTTRFFFKLNGIFDRLSPTVLEKLLIRDRAAFRAGLKQILEWPFERVIVTHGAVKESGGREQLRQGYAWLLER